MDDAELHRSWWRRQQRLVGLRPLRSRVSDPQAPSPVAVGSVVVAVRVVSRMGHLSLLLTKSLSIDVRLVPWRAESCRS